MVGVGEKEVKPSSRHDGSENNTGNEVYADIGT